MTKAELYQKAKSLPLLPGVYIIRNRGGAIIYIGKAKRLRPRVSQYFREGVSHDEKTTRMVAAAFDLDIIVTGSEFEALVLECEQIKLHYPKYNVLLKDDKGYRYIRISAGDWPRLFAEKQKREEEGETWLGPYMSGYAVNQSVAAAQDSFLLPRCSRRFPQDFGRQRPCLYAHIGKCMAVCTGKVSRQRYAQAMQNAVRLLAGGGDALLREMQREMDAAAETLEFERAAQIRDQIRSLQKLREVQTLVKEDDRDQDVIAFAQGAGAACVAILRFRAGQLCDKREFLFHDTTTLAALREEFLPRYYMEPEEEVPHVIAVDAPLPAQDLLERLLAEKRGGRVRIYTPERGDRRRLVQTAYINAVERMARESGHTKKEDKTLDELAGLLGLSAAPALIESYDISNWGDGTSVCGMVVFENGRPKKAGYRRFKMRTVPGTDDYASLAETLLRRAGEYDAGAAGQFGEKPSLLLIDGGRGQAAAAAAALAATGLADVPLFGMVKDERHRTRGIVSPAGQEIALAMHRGPFSLISAIQNETHRFALAYQRSAAKARAFSSTLTQIPGVGPATAKALLAHFKTVRAVAAAAAAELSAVRGISQKTAAAIFFHFHAETGK